MRFTVSGPPVPKARPRFTRSGHTYTPAGTLEQERRIRAAYLTAGCGSMEGPLAVRIRAVMPYPKNYPKKRRGPDVWHYKRPDADNIAKTVLDALNGVAYKDDGQVARLVVEKLYGSEPRTEIEIVQEGAA